MSFLSRSDDSDSSESSGFGSHGRQRRTSTLDSHDNRRENTPGSPPLKKLRRSDYNAFASLVNGLKQTRPTKPLNERLLVRSVTPSRPQPDVTATGRGVTPIVELPPTSRPARPGTRLKFDAQAKVDQLLDDRWPLYSQQLDPRADFAECIGTVASKLVRVRRMVNPYIWNKAHVMEETLDEGDDVFAPLPEDLVESTRMYLDKLLAGLAILRPSMTRPQRERLAPTGWRAVLETAGLVKHGSSIARSANERVLRLLGAEATSATATSERDSILQVQQRLDLFTSQRTKRKRRDVDDDAILAAVLKPKRPTKTQIQAKEAQERVDAQREKKTAKLVQAAKKRAIKHAKALRKDEAYQQHISAEKEQIEIKKRLARAENKRKREEDKAQKEERKRLRAERREGKRKRAEARAESVHSKEVARSRNAHEEGNAPGRGQSAVEDIDRLPARLENKRPS